MLAGCATRRHTDPLPAEDRLNLGLAYEQRGNPEQALIEYRRAARGDLAATAHTYIGNLHLNRGEYNEAERAYRAAIREDADQIMALNNLAWLLLQTDGDLLEAESLAMRALDLNPEAPDPVDNTLQQIRKRMNAPDTSHQPQ